MRTLRSRLIVIFLVATLLPLAATLWVTRSLLERSLGYATTADLDRLADSAEAAVRSFYDRERSALRAAADRGDGPSLHYRTSTQDTWPVSVQAFWDGGEPEGFDVAGPDGERLDYLRRTADGVSVFSRSLGVAMQPLAAEFRRARQQVAAGEGRDLERGFTLTLLFLVTLVWLGSLVPLFFVAHRISRPIRQLTAGLSDFAMGDWDRRIPPARDDEIGQAVVAFNDMADQFRAHRERLVYLTQMSSWQSLARKTAHELKNSMTPIRLTVEEMAARTSGPDRAFMDQAVAIVVSEIETLERRVRAFSELSSEPPSTPAPVDPNLLAAERVSLLRKAHPGIEFRTRFESGLPPAWVDSDLVKGILTNLLANAAEAAAPDGTVLVATRGLEGKVVVEVHDSGPGIGPGVAATLFEPTITFKKQGMGLGLSIARKNALLVGGDIALVSGELTGAAFRVTLPAVPANRGGRP